MKAPISWLQDFVKIDIPAEALADKLVHAGFEVEEIIREADAIKTSLRDACSQWNATPIPTTSGFARSTLKP